MKLSGISNLLNNVLRPGIDDALSMTSSRASDDSRTITGDQRAVAVSTDDMVGKIRTNLPRIGGRGVAAYKSVSSWSGRTPDIVQLAVKSLINLICESCARRIKNVHPFPPAGANYLLSTYIKRKPIFSKKMQAINKLYLV